MSNISSKVPAWALLVIYLGILIIFAVFGDLFTLIVGGLILSIVFANGYNRENSNDH